MIYYYIEKNGKIQLCDTDITKIKNTLAFMPDLARETILQTEDEILYKNGEFVFTKDIQDELLEDAKQECIKQINEQKESAFKAGFYFNEIHFDCDDRAQIRLSAQLAIAQPETTIIWLDYDYQPVNFSYEEFVQMCAVATQVVSNIEFETATLLEQVQNAKTLEELNLVSIDFAKCLSL